MSLDLAGYLCKLYRNTATHATPTWSLITAVRDLDVARTRGELDSSTRDSKYKKYVAGMLDEGITFELTYRNGNADHGALNTAFEAGTAIEFAAMDGAIATSGQEGLRAYMIVTDFSHSQPLEDGVKVSVALKPSYFEESAALVDADWYAVP